MRIAVWSGPRNLSTAMMYAFGARPDCTVVDEPFYAAWLSASRALHPMRDEILLSQPHDAREVVARIMAPPDRPHLYLKLMTHHMLPPFPLDWARECVNVHLIRHPARVAASYGAKREAVTLADIGFAEQHRLWRHLGGPVIDSADIRADPRGMLRRLCAQIGLPFHPAMLSWPPGGRAEDGVWAAHWYGAVHRSTGFAGPEGELPEVDGAVAEVVAQALPIYEEMAASRIGA